MNCCDWKDRNVPYWVSLEFKFFLTVEDIFEASTRTATPARFLWTQNLSWPKLGQFCLILSDLQALKWSIKTGNKFFAQNAQLERFRSAIKVLQNLCRRNDKVEELIEVDGKGWSIFNNPILTSRGKNLHNWMSVLFVIFLQLLWCHIVFETSLTWRKSSGNILAERFSLLKVI